MNQFLEACTNCNTDVLCSSVLIPLESLIYPKYAQVTLHLRNVFMAQSLPFYATTPQVSALCHLQIPITH